MPITIDDACDLLRGRVRRLAGKDGQRRLKAVAKEMGISSPSLLSFMNATHATNMACLLLIEDWCNREEHTNNANR